MATAFAMDEFAHRPAFEDGKGDEEVTPTLLGMIYIAESGYTGYIVDNQ
jgi:hypothetical protein